MVIGQSVAGNLGGAWCCCCSRGERSACPGGGAFGTKKRKTVFFFFDQRRLEAWSTIAAVVDWSSLVPGSDIASDQSLNRRRNQPARVGCGIGIAAWGCSSVGVHMPRGHSVTGDTAQFWETESIAQRESRSRGRIAGPNQPVLDQGQLTLGLIAGNGFTSQAQRQLLSAG